MSRVGIQPVLLPGGVEASLSPGSLSVKGPKGNLAVSFDPSQISVEVNDGTVQVNRRDESKIARSLHGLIRSLVANAVAGVTSGFQKRLDVYGVGFRADVQGRKLTLEIGYSHSVVYEAPEGIEITTEDPQGGAQARIVVSGIDKQKVGQVAADIRFKRKPEPYKGKGIRYQDEIIHFKAGKSAVA